MSRRATVMEVNSATARVRKLTRQAMDDLVATVEAGKSDQLKAYLGMVGRFHRYSFGNVLLIASQRPGATFVAGYRRWQELGRQVRKGQKAIRIMAPIRRGRRQGDEEQVTESEEGKDQVEEPPVAFRVVHVFDQAQTDGKPLPQFAQVGGEPGEAADSLKALVAQKGIELHYSDSLNGASGYSAGGRIVLKNGMTPAEEFSTMVHELAHEMLHQEKDKPEDRKVRETEAEAVAFAVCQGIGLDASGASSDYVLLHGGDKEALLASLERIRNAAHEILEAVLPATWAKHHRRSGTAQMNGIATPGLSAP